MNTDSRRNYLLKNTMLFTIGNLGSKLISFFLIPLYTNALTTGQYGTVDLITTVSTVAVPVITLNIGESVMRFALDKNADHKMITRCGIYVLLVGSLFGIIIIPICKIFGSLSAYSIFTYFYVISSAFSQLFLCDLRGKELLLQYSIGNIINTLLIAVFNVVLLVAFSRGIEGYLMAYILANFITALYAIVVGKSLSKSQIRRINVPLLKEMVRYSIVLIPNSFMWWIMNSSDRIMVTGMVGIAANGIYAISYKLPTLVITLTQVFNQAWGYSAIREQNAVDESEYNNKVFKALTGFIMLVGIAILTFSKPFLRIYVSANYFTAWKYIPFLTIGCVYLTLGTFIATSYTVHKDSFGYLFSGMFGAVFNIVLNFVLIPIIQVYGAALATCMSYILVFLFRMVHTRKYIRYKINNVEFIGGTAILLLSSCCIYINGKIGFMAQVGLLVAAFFLFRDSWKPVILSIFRKAKR